MKRKGKRRRWGGGGGVGGDVTKNLEVSSSYTDEDPTVQEGSREGSKERSQEVRGRGGGDEAPRVDYF